MNTDSALGSQEPIISSKRKEIDWLSNLPDHLIHRILSLLDTKSAIKTCVLSKTWRYHWQCLHTISFDSATFNNRRVFEQFVRQVLDHRQPLKLSKLKFHSGCRQKPSLVDRIFSYAKSHDVEELETDVENFPPSFLICQTLKTLKYSSRCTIRDLPNQFTGFTSLTTLQLSNVILQNCDFTSSLLDLENLIIMECHLIELETLNISAPRLVNLTISNLHLYFLDTKLVISAPRLKFFRFHGTYPLELLNMSDCPALDKVEIDSLYFLRYFPVGRIRDFDFISYLISFCQKFSHAKSYTISLDTIDQPRFILYRRSLGMSIKILPENMILSPFNS